MFGKNKVATLVAEFLGTGVLTFLVLSVKYSTIGVPFFVAATAGLTVAMLSYAFAGVSGGYFNPALAIGAWSARKLATTSALLYIVVQFAGAYAAYWLYTYFVNNTLQQIGGHPSERILIAEAVGAAVFALGWASGLYQNFSSGVKCSLAGLSLTIGIIAASSASLGLLNPAVAVGVRAVNWAYILGPIIGAVIGFNLYGLVFAPTEAKPAKAAAVAPAKAKTPAKKKASRAKK